MSNRTCTCPTILHVYFCESIFCLPSNIEQTFHVHPTVVMIQAHTIIVDFSLDKVNGFSLLTFSISVLVTFLYDDDSVCPPLYTVQSTVSMSFCDVYTLSQLKLVSQSSVLPLLNVCLHGGTIGTKDTQESARITERSSYFLT